MVTMAARASIRTTVQYVMIGSNFPYRQSRRYIRTARMSIHVAGMFYPSAAIVADEVHVWLP